MKGLENMRKTKLLPRKRRMNKLEEARLRNDRAVFRITKLTKYRNKQVYDSLINKYLRNEPNL